MRTNIPASLAVLSSLVSICCEIHSSVKPGPTPKVGFFLAERDVRGPTQYGIWQVSEGERPLFVAHLSVLPNGNLALRAVGGGTATQTELFNHLTDVLALAAYRHVNTLPNHKVNQGGMEFYINESPGRTLTLDGILQFVVSEQSCTRPDPDAGIDGSPVWEEAIALRKELRDWMKLAQPIRGLNVLTDEVAQQWLGFCNRGRDIRSYMTQPRNVTEMVTEVATVDETEEEIPF